MPLDHGASSTVAAQIEAVLRALPPRTGDRPLHAGHLAGKAPDQLREALVAFYSGAVLAPLHVPGDDDFRTTLADRAKAFRHASPQIVERELAKIAPGLHSKDGLRRQLASVHATTVARLMAVGLTREDLPHLPAAKVARLLARARAIAPKRTRRPFAKIKPAAQGRPANLHAKVVAHYAARAYPDLTGKAAATTVNSYTSARGGAFVVSTR
jgi:hypothetical protein